jgi:phospholipase C
MAMDQIQHFVLVMMENRSFDHYLGALNLAPEYRDDIEGLGRVLPVNRHLHDGPGDIGVPPWPLDDVKLEFYDPPHEGPEVRQQWNGGRMDGFVSAYEAFHTRALASRPTAANVSPLLGTSAPAPPDLRQMGRVVMGYYTRKTLPVLYQLADQFTVFDHWHSSFLGSTHPNRVFAMAGDAGDVVTTTWKTALRRKPAPIWGAWERKRGSRSGLTWKTYKLPSELSMFALWPGFANNRDANAGTLADFVADCKADALPQVAIVEPPYSSADDHPTHDPRRGQQFLGYILEALRSSPSWKSTAFILTYDEHGGFFDHVPPPATPEARPEPWEALGVRVPAIVASPYTPRSVVSDVFDHTSILKTIAERWGLDLPAEAGVRLPKVKSLWDCGFDFARRRARSGSSITVPALSADWRAQITPEGDGPVRSDMAESLARAAQVSSLASLEAMMTERTTPRP